MFIGLFSSVNLFIVAIFTSVLMNKDFDLGYLIAAQCKSNGAGFDRRIGNKRNMARPIVSKQVFPKTKIFEAIACAFDLSRD